MNNLGIFGYRKCVNIPLLLTPQALSATEYQDFWVGATFYNYSGYSDLDTMFNNCVTQYVDKYTYESTVTEE